MVALSLAWGQPIAWVRRNLSAREFAFWRREYSERPFDAEGSFHIPIAQLSAMFANANRAKESQPAKVADFLPFRKQEPKSIDEELLSNGW